jgi:hypothetical protein
LADLGERGIVYIDDPDGKIGIPGPRADLLIMIENDIAQTVDERRARQAEDQTCSYGWQPDQNMKQCANEPLP